ncbi:MFS transporter [Chelatococcus reniformis]|uniref:MFS transporter n=1 Tax=Chelatococcus reniformis TaxID=1494448 RepID=A0A916XCA8_9HYPH|nr:MFS transporter [Chelatococcus reniformis]GGC63428.1 MFS transporter [Chelatococcus reniformis]
MTIASTVAAEPPVDRLSQRAAMTMLVIMGVTYAINAMDRIVFAILLPNVNAHYAFSLEQGGFLATVFTLGIGLSGIPTGYLLDRFSRMKVILIGMLIYSVLTILSAFSVGFYDMAVYRALSGIGEGMQNAALFTAVGAYFAANRAVALGSMNFAYGIGSFVGPILAAYLLVWTNDWRTPLIVYGVLGLAIMVLARLTVSPAFTEHRNEPLDLAASGADEYIPARVLNRNVLICALSAIVLGVAGYGFLGLYPTFLRTELGLSIPQAGFAASLFGLGALLGIPAGYMADRVSQRWIAIVAISVMIVNSYLMFNVATSAPAQYALAFVAGAVGSGVVFVNTYSLIQRCVRPAFVGRASGIMVTCLYLPASLAGYLFAALRTQFGWGQASLLQLCLFPLIAIVAMLFLDAKAVRRARPPA